MDGIIESKYLVELVNAACDGLHSEQQLEVTDHAIDRKFRVVLRYAQQGK